jgi:hypothetical protein
LRDKTRLHEKTKHPSNDESFCFDQLDGTPWEFKHHYKNHKANHIVADCYKEAIETEKEEGEEKE